MTARTGTVGVVTLVLVLAAACGPDAGPASPTATTSATSTQAAGFPTDEFDTNEATIRQLLGHRSGLPDYYELGPLEGIQTDFMPSTIT